MPRAFLLYSTTFQFLQFLFIFQFMKPICAIQYLHKLQITTTFYVFLAKKDHLILLHNSFDNLLPRKEDFKNRKTWQFNVLTATMNLHSLDNNCTPFKPFLRRFISFAWLNYPKSNPYTNEGLKNCQEMSNNKGYIKLIIPSVNSAIQ